MIGLTTNKPELSTVMLSEIGATLIPAVVFGGHFVCLNLPNVIAKIFIV